MKKTDTPSREDEIAFAERHLALLVDHDYYTDEVKELFPHQSENLKFAAQHLGFLKS